MDTFIENKRPFAIEWPEPDMSLVRSRRSAPPPLPIELLGEKWGNWVVETAKARSAPVDYVFAGWCSIIAAMIGGARRASPWGDWSEPTIVNFGILGSPSSNKTPSLRPALGLLKKVEAEMNLDYEDRLRKYEAEKAFAAVKADAWKSQVKEAADSGHPPPDKPKDAVEPDAPARKSVLVGDTTPEALTTILTDNPKGVLLFSDELAGFFKNFTRYSGDARAFYLDAFNGDARPTDREKYGGKPKIIPFLGVSILGGIQPDRMSEMLKDVDDGLLARFVLLWPEPVPRERPDDAVNNDFVERAFSRLGALDYFRDEDGRIQPSHLKFDAAGAEIFERWWIENGANELSIGSGPLKSFYGKLPGYCVRFACMFEYADWSIGSGPEPSMISELSVRRACQLVDHYIWPMAQRVHGDAIRTKVDHQAAALCRKIVTERMATINGKALYREYGIPGVNCAEEARPVIQALVERDWLIPDDIQERGRGRPASDWLVNPRVLREVSNA
jgi:hypothetical protein